jgi:hypothetical protein
MRARAANIGRQWRAYRQRYCRDPGTVGQADRQEALAEDMREDSTKKQLGDAAEAERAAEFNPIRSFPIGSYGRFNEVYTDLKLHERVPGHSRPVASFRLQ